MSVRSARFTALAFPKAAATSGSSTTIWLPGLRRAAYLPRTPPLKSYSRRIAALAGRRRDFGLGFFFIGLPLLAGGSAGTDDSDQIPAFDMRHHDEPAALGLANQDKPFLTNRVVRIRHRQ